MSFHTHTTTAACLSTPAPWLRCSTPPSSPPLQHVINHLHAPATESLPTAAAATDSLRLSDALPALVAPMNSTLSPQFQLQTAMLQHPHHAPFPFPSTLASLAPPSGATVSVLDGIKALRSLKQSHGASHRETVLATLALAKAFAAKGRWGDAASLFEEALPLQVAQLGEDHADTILTMVDLSLALERCERCHDAVAMMSRAVDLSTIALGEAHVTTLTAMLSLGNFLIKSSPGSDVQPDQACAVLRRAYAITKTVPNVTEADICDVRGLYCRALTASGQLAEVRVVHSDALQTSRARHGDMGMVTVGAMQQLAQTCHALGDHAAAAALYAEADGVLKETVGRFHPKRVQVLYQHAVVYHDAGEYALAEVLCEEAVSSCRQVIGPHQNSSIVLLDSICLLAQLRTRSGRMCEAEALLREAVATTAQTAACRPRAISLQLQLAHVLAHRRSFAEALQLTSSACAAWRMNDSMKRDGLGAGSDARGEQLTLLRSHGAMLEGAGRYSEAHAVYRSIWQFWHSAAAVVAADDGDNDAAAAAAAAALSAHAHQQQLRSPFAHRCHSLHLLLRAAAACSTFISGPRRHPHPSISILSPPSHTALALAGHLWRDNDAGADARTRHAQRLQLLCLACAPAAVAARLAAPHLHAGSGSGRPGVVAACIMRRCFSARGVSLLLRTCAQPPEYYPSA